MRVASFDYQRAMRDTIKKVYLAMEQYHRNSYGTPLPIVRQKLRASRARLREIDDEGQVAGARSCGIAPPLQAAPHVAARGLLLVW